MRPHIPLTTWLIACYAFLYAPIAFLIVLSFNASRLVTAWDGFSPRWYFTLAHDRNLIDAALLSLRIAALSATLALIIGTLAGYALARFGRFRARAAFAAAVAAPLVLPEVITGLYKLKSAGLHGPHAHGNVAVAGDEDDWYLDAGRFELGLKVETAQARQLNVENQAGWNIRAGGCHELSGRRKSLGPGRPTDAIKSTMDSRTRGSSSMTNTMQSRSLMRWLRPAERSETQPHGAGSLRPRAGRHAPR